MCVTIRTIIRYATSFIGKNNFKLPKGKKPEELTLAECLEIAENQGTKKPTKRK